MRSHNFADPCFGLSNGSVDVAFVRPPLLMQDWLSVETLFVEPRVLVTSSSSPLAVREQVAVEDVLDEAFVARRAPDYWRDFWLAVSSRGSHAPKLGAEVAGGRRVLRGDPRRTCGGVHPGLDPALLRPAGLAFIPVNGLPPSTLAIAWRNDMDAQPVKDFVETARMLAALDLVPQAYAPDDAALPTLATVNS